MTAGLLERFVGADEAARLRRRAEAIERFRSRYVGSSACAAETFDVHSWAARADRVDSRPTRPTATPKQFRMKKRGELLARLVERAKPYILDAIALELGEIAAVAVQSALSQERHV